MKTKIIVVGIIGLAPFSYAHEASGHLLVNGTDTGLWKNVLEVNGPGPQLGYTNPIKGDEVHTENGTCGRGAFSSMYRTAIADVVAGEVVGFRVNTAGEIYGAPPDMEFPNSEYGTFFHPGPGQIYLSKAPNDDLKAYRGEGDWFKIAYAGPANNTYWKLGAHTVKDFNFTIPQMTPPGKYLMRIEHLWPQVNGMATQFYINCALVNIIGRGGGKPTEFIKFPEGYGFHDIGIEVPYSQTDNVPLEQQRMLDYKPPGPSVWAG